MMLQINNITIEAITVNSYMFLDGGVEAWTMSLSWDNTCIYGVFGVVD